MESGLTNPPALIGTGAAKGVTSTGQRAITADTDLRLCRFLGLSPGYWLRAQAAHDTELASAELADELEQIQPLVAAQT